MEKILAYVARAEECQVLARAAFNDASQLEYLKLAASWIDLAAERRQFLIETGRARPH